MVPVFEQLRLGMFHRLFLASRLAGWLKTKLQAADHGTPQKVFGR